MSLAALLIAGARARVTVRRGGAVCVRVQRVFLADCVLVPRCVNGVLGHRVARPLRGSVSCGSGWSVPCVSIQLTL